MTSSDLVVANIAPHKDGPATLDLERLQNTTKDTRTGTEIAGYAEVPNNNSQGSVHEDAELRKVWNRGRKTTLKVQRLLTGTIENQDFAVDVRAATVIVGKLSIVEGPPTDCRARDIVGTRSFQKMEFNCSGTTGIKSVEATPTQYLHFSSPSLKMGDNIVDSNGQPVHDSIAIVSGKGLFSSSVMSCCHLADGSLDLATLKFAQPTTYEIEYIARAAPAIADLACTMLLNNKAANITTPLSIDLDIPHWHYYQAVEEKLQKGLCTANDALLYFEAIKRRYDQVSSVFTTAILHEFALRGETNPIINVAPKLNVVADCVKSALIKGTRPSFPKVMQALDEEEDGIWRRFYRLIPAKECPRDFEELGHLLYVLQVVKSAFRAQAPSQITDCDFEPSIHVPEEMSICLSSMASGNLHMLGTDDYPVDAWRCEFGPRWSLYQSDGLANDAADVKDDDELSFDAPSTVEIRVVSSDIWASTVHGECSDSDDIPELITIVEDIAFTTTDEEDDVEAVSWPSPRLIGEDEAMVPTASKTFHLPPASEAATSTACMLGLPSHNLSRNTAELDFGDPHDAMSSTFEEANSFCHAIISTDSQLSADDEVASHGFMLPSPVLSRSFWTPATGHVLFEEAAPILADDNSSHEAMLSTCVGRSARKFDMDSGITEDDGAALDDISSFAVMASITGGTITKRKAAAELHRRQPPSKDECLSGAIMLPTSELASNHYMAAAGWDMDDTTPCDVIAAHHAMSQTSSDAVTANKDCVQPAGSDEHASCILMLPRSEAASAACMLVISEHETPAGSYDEHSSHVSMLNTFEEPSSLDMAEEMCIAAALAPLDPPLDDPSIEFAADERAAHAAMLCAIIDSEVQEFASISHVELSSDDTTVSHFAMLANGDDGISSASMAALITSHIAGLHGPSVTMPAEEHVSHTAMSCADPDESTAYMATTLSVEDLEQRDGMPATHLNFELASHAATRRIIGLSSSFCMAETLVSAQQSTEDDSTVTTKEKVDHHVVILPTAVNNEASNITMLFLPADEADSHAAMFPSYKNDIQPMSDHGKTSHIALLSDSVAPFYLGPVTKPSTIMDGTADGLGSHAVMVPTSTDDFESHDVMLPTSTDELASDEMMRTTSNDEVQSHITMVSELQATDFRAAQTAAEDIDSHNAMLTSSACMAATLSAKMRPSLSPIASSTATQASPASSSSSISSTSSGFVMLPNNSSSTDTTTEKIKKPRVLIISVDDSSERKIYGRAQEMIEKLRADPEAATYPTLVEAYLYEESLCR